MANAPESQRAKLLRNTLQLSMGTYSEYLLGMVASVLLARYLGPEEYGIYGIVIWVAILARTLINSGVTLGAIRFIAAASSKHGTAIAKSVARYFTRVHFIKLAIVITVGAIATPFFAPQVFPDIPLIAFWLVLAAIAFRTTYMFFVSVAKGQEDFKSVAIITSVGAVINLAMIVVGVALEFNYVQFIGVFLLSGITFFLLSMWRTRRLVMAGAGDEIPVEMQEKIGHHLRIVTATILISYFASREIEFLFLGVLGEAAEVGYFKVAMTLAAGIVLLVPGVFSGVLLPVMARSIVEGEQAAGRRLIVATRYLITLAMPLAIFFAIFGESFVAVIYGPEYVAAGFAFTMCIIAGCVTTTADSAQSYLLSSNRQAFILKLVIAAVVVKLTIGLATVSAYGLNGAVWVFVSVSLMVAISKFFVACRDLDIQFPVLALFKAGVAGGFAVTSAWFCASQVSVIWIGLIVAGFVFGGAYALLTFVLGCWSQADLIFFGQLSAKLPKPLSIPVGKTLKWAAGRRLARI